MNKKFIAKPYLVEIWEGDKKHSLSINDATATFRSIQLDELSDKILKTLNEYNAILPVTKSIFDSGKDVSNLTEEEIQTIKDYERISRELKKLNVEFIKLNVKDWEKNIQYIDDIKIHEREDFFAAIKRASLGIQDEEESKKKLRFKKSIGRSRKYNLKNTGSVKMK